MRAARPGFTFAWRRAVRPTLPAAVVALTFWRAAALALRAAGAHWADFFRCQFAVAVFVEFLERFGCLLDFLCVNLAVVIGIECGHQRGAHAGLAWSAGAAFRALAARPFAILRRR